MKFISRHPDIKINTTEQNKDLHSDSRTSVGTTRPVSAASPSLFVIGDIAIDNNMNIALTINPLRPTRYIALTRGKRKDYQKKKPSISSNKHMHKPFNQPQ
jgi:hypothetical protein